MMKNLVGLSFYVWLVQVVIRKMKEEQVDEENQRLLSSRDQPNDEESC
jgi:hypothetical protein